MFCENKTCFTKTSHVSLDFNAKHDLFWHGPKQCMFSEDVLFWQDTQNKACQNKACFRCLVFEDVLFSWQQRIHGGCHGQHASWAHQDIHGSLGQYASTGLRGTTETLVEPMGKHHFQVRLKILLMIGGLCYGNGNWSTQQQAPQYMPRTKTRHGQNKACQNNVCFGCLVFCVSYISGDI